MNKETRDFEEKEGGREWKGQTPRGGIYWLNRDDGSILKFLSNDNWEKKDKSDQLGKTVASSCSLRYSRHKSSSKTGEMCDVDADSVKN